MTIENYHILNKEDINKPKTNIYKIPLISIVILIVLLLALILSIFVIKYRTQITGKAYGVITEDNVELNNSYLFASPLKAKADGKERIRLTIFILNSQGKGIYGKNIVLSINNYLKIESIQDKTDEYGRAIFDITSTKSGIYAIEASVEGKILPQKVNIIYE